jgi:hypothetical protein
MPRNSSGTYSLPTGNPVVSNTLIQSTWANTTMSDIGSSLTDSLDRFGRGSMQAPLKGIDGTAVAPAYSFSSEGTLGIYRAGAGVIGFSVAGALVLSIATTGLVFTNPLVLPVGSAAAPALTFTGNTNTGIYQNATNNVSVSLNGILAASFDVLRLTYTGGLRAAKSSSGYIDLDASGMTSDYQGALKLLDSGFDVSTNTASRGFTWTNNGTLRMTLSPGGNLTLASGNFVLTAGTQVIFNATGANTITANNAAGTLALQTGGANNRLTIDAAGATVLSGATTFSSTVLHAGGVTMNNAINLLWKDSGGTARSVVFMNSSNNIFLGDVGNAIVGGSTNISANSSLIFTVNAAALATLSSVSLTLASGVLISTANAEAMRIRNDAGFLSIYNSAGTTRTGILLGNTGAALNLNAENGAILAFAAGGTTRVRIDTAGNLLVGVTTSANAYTSGYVIQVHSGLTLFGTSTAAFLGNNLGADSSGNPIYVANGLASWYRQDTGFHRWFTAPTGIAGASATGVQMMTLDPNNNLLIGTTNSLYWSAGRACLEINGSSMSVLACRVAGSQGWASWHDGTNAYTSAESGSLILKTAGVNRITISGTLGNTTIAGGAGTPVNAIGNTGGTVTVDMSKSNVHTLTLTSNMTSLVLNNPVDGQTINVFITQDGTGSRTATWGSSIKWPGGVAGVLSTAASAVDLAVLTYRTATGFFYASLSKAFA